MQNIYKGNAYIDGKPHRDWIIGHFMPDGDIRKSGDVEIKWGAHGKGEVRSEWVTGEHRTAVAILISGKFAIEFRDKTIVLEKPGDYAMWGNGVDHRWKALEDMLVVFVRWPSE